MGLRMFSPGRFTPAQVLALAVPAGSPPQPLAQTKPAGREAEEMQSRASAQPEQRGAATWQGDSLRLQG